MLIIALVFPVTLLVVAMLLSSLERWMDREPGPTWRFASPDTDNGEPVSREQPWAYGIKEGASR